MSLTDKIKRYAVTIENPNQLRNFKLLCDSNNVVYSAPKESEIKFPHYHLLMPIGEILQSVYNDKLDQHCFSVKAMDYYICPFSLFKKNTDMYLKVGEDFYEN